MGGKHLRLNVVIAPLQTSVALPASPYGKKGMLIHVQFKRYYWEIRMQAIEQRLHHTSFVQDWLRHCSTRPQCRRSDARQSTNTHLNHMFTVAQLGKARLQCMVTNATKQSL